MSNDNDSEAPGFGPSAVERRVRVPVYIESLAHRMCWRYKKSQDPCHSDTYTFNAATLKDFAEKLIQNEREACAARCEAIGWGNNADVNPMAGTVCAKAIRGRSNVEISSVVQNADQSHAGGPSAGLEG